MKIDKAATKEFGIKVCRTPAKAKKQSKKDNSEKKSEKTFELREEKVSEFRDEESVE